MSRLLWLPDVLRAAGLTVYEVPGWEKRGADTFGPVVGITIHETRGSLTSSDAGEIRTLVEGSETAPPPIAPLYLSRSGAWHVVASGTCNHNRIGYAGPNEGYGNDNLLGIEAQHSAGEPWTDVQYRSYVRGVAALADRLDVPVARIAGHKEHQPGQKTDPGFDMDRFRADVARILAGEDTILSALTDAEQRELLETVRAIKTVTNVAGYRTEAIISGRATYNNQLGDKQAPNVLAQRLAALGEAIAAESSNPAEIRAMLAELPDPPAAADIAADVLAGLDPAAIAAAIPTDVARQVADEIAARLQS